MYMAKLEVWKLMLY